MTPGTTTTAASVARPAMVWKPIPFGPRRKREMAAYSKRHYGRATWRLTNPHVVVEHFTGSDCFSCAWNTFASNSPDLGELPGTCAHFIVARNGTVYQLVRLWIRCRHTVGLNWTAFGIEMVGRSDSEILHDSRQLHAALRLSLWLMSHFGIYLENVIGHNESLNSPYHHELYPSWRCQTHSDWKRADMRIFRRKLHRMANVHHVPIGPWPPHWVASNC
jgi:N-acetylmuramoyl-L-alanine amidase-like protein